LPVGQIDEYIDSFTNQHSPYRAIITYSCGDSDILIRDRENKLIKKIRKALDRIENNTSEVCEKCGKDISFARLKARPVTTQCIDCKTKEEATEKTLGL
jgi:RNA polymerase-binding transcription factor DksA